MAGYIIELNNCCGYHKGSVPYTNEFGTRIKVNNDFGFEVELQVVGERSDYKLLLCLILPTIVVTSPITLFLFLEPSSHVYLTVRFIDINVASCWTKISAHLCKSARTRLCSFPKLNRGFTAPL